MQNFGKFYQLFELFAPFYSLIFLLYHCEVNSNPSSYSKVHHLLAKFDFCHQNIIFHSGTCKFFSQGYLIHIPITVICLNNNQENITINLEKAINQHDLTRKFVLKCEINIFSYEIEPNLNTNSFSLLKSVLFLKARPYYLKTSLDSKTAFAPKVENVFNLLITPETVKISQPIKIIESILIKSKLKNLFWIFAFVTLDSTEIKAQLFFHCFFCKYPSTIIEPCLTLLKLQNLVHLQSAGFTWRLQGLKYYPTGAGLTPKVFMDRAAKLRSQIDQNDIGLPSLVFVMIQATANAGLNQSAWKKETNSVADFHFFGLNLMIDFWYGPVYAYGWFPDNLFSFVTCGTSESSTDSLNLWISFITPLKIEVWAALAGLIALFTLTVAFWVYLKRSSISVKLVFLRLLEFCLTALLRISVLDRTQIICQTFRFNGAAVLWLFISFLVSSLYEADMTQALIVEPEFDHPFDFASVLQLHYTIMLLEKHPDFYNKTTDQFDEQKNDLDNFTELWFRSISHSFFLRYDIITKQIELKIKLKQIENIYGVVNLKKLSRSIF